MPASRPVRLASLSLAITGLLLLVLWTGAGARAAESTMTAPDARASAVSGRVTLVDVRSPQEWRQTGVPSGASAITIHNRDGIKAFVAEVEKAVGGDRSKPIALICAGGVRSARALEILAAAGFTRIHDVSEGMLGRPDAGPGWLQRGLPVTDPASLR